MADYKVTSVRPSTYMNKAGKPVNGYAVTVYFPEFDEAFEVHVATRDKDAVATEISKELEFRRGLADLG